MKLQEKPVRQKTNIKGTTFSIEMNGMIFDILINKGYADKITSVVREIGCNANDAHKEIGNPEPFIVKTPNLNKGTFLIRDFGPGLSDDDIHNLYTKLGASSKHANNDLTGCIGIGSKSPFAYVSDNSQCFTTRSFYNGIVRTYNCYIDCDSKLPCVAMVHEDETDEPNGLEVSFHVADKDRNKFDQAVGEVYSLFDVSPIVNDHPLVSFYDSKVSHAMSVKNNKSNIHNLDYVNTKDWQSYVIMGQVKYPIDNATFSSYPKLKSILNSGVIIHMEMGEVDFTPFRETLEYTDKTIVQIVTSLENILAEMEKKIDEETKDLGYWDKAIYQMDLPAPFGKKSEDLYTLLATAYDKYQNATGRRNGRLVTTIYPNKQSIFLYQDTKKGCKSKAKHLTKRFAGSYWVREDAPAVYIVDDEFLSVLGIDKNHPNVILASSLDNKTVTRSRYGTTEVMTLSQYAALKNTEVEIDNGTYYYWPTFQLKPILTCGKEPKDSFRIQLMQAKNIAEALQQEKVIPQDAEIVLTRGDTLRKIKNKKNWISISDLFEDYVKSWWNKNKSHVENSHDWKYSLGNTESELVDFLVKIKTANKPRHSRGFNLVKRLQKKEKQNQKDKLESVMLGLGKVAQDFFIEHITGETVNYSEHQDTKYCLDLLMEEFPMFKLITSAWLLNKEHEKIITDYLSK